MRFTLCVTLAFLAGCSGYSQFYTSSPGATPEAIASLREGPPPKVPAVARGAGDPSATVADYTRRGYGLIGYSSFSSGTRESDSSAIEQGKKVGADIVVIFDPSYAGSVTSTIPISTPTSSTSYTTGSATAFGTGGSATAYGNSTTTTYGTQTNYVPFTVQRFNYGALYFVKRHYKLGVNTRPLNDQERSAFQSNKGLYVTMVVDDTPAFRDDMLVGDIITGIDGLPVFGQQDLFDSVDKKAGQRVDITLVRNGQQLTKSVQLNR